jgi:glutamate formiminotransferase
MIVECVPNFSEGRDAGQVDRIAETIAGVSGVHVADVHLDADHNRSVITFAGPHDAVQEASVRAVGTAIPLIDLNHHHGEHPRIGAVDVIPFVPLQGIDLSGCATIAHQAGREIWERHRIPVYFYEAAAMREDRRNLAGIRRGGYETLKVEVEVDPARRPDVGEPHLHPTAGATAVGARNVLIAFNVNLDTDQLWIAKAIAAAVRASTGGLPAVKAMGIPLRSRSVAGKRSQCQVSMNLTDWRQTSVWQAFEAVRDHASRHAVSIESSEVVGLVPAAALGGATPAELQLAEFGPDKILERRIAAVLGKPSAGWELST